MASAIRINYNTLSTAQQKIGDFVLQNTQRVMYLSITDLAAQCDTSETTIMRFLRKIGFTSYQVFRVKLAQSLQKDNPKYPWSEIESEDSLSIITGKVITSTITALEDIRQLITPALVSQAVELIVGAKRVFVYGVGSSSYIAGDLFHKLIRLGLNASTCSDSHIMSIQTEQSLLGDLFIFVSHTGESHIIVQNADGAKNGGVGVLSITSYRHSSLAKLSDCTLISSTNEMNYRPDAMTSRIIQLVIIDVLTVALTIRLGKSGVDSVARSQIAVAKQKR